jgi:hypothetical protein
LDEVLEVEEEIEVEDKGERVIEVGFGGPGFVSMSPASISSAADDLWESRGQHGQKTGSEESPFGIERRQEKCTAFELFEF